MFAARTGREKPQYMTECEKSLLHFVRFRLKCAFNFLEGRGRECSRVEGSPRLLAGAMCASKQPVFADFGYGTPGGALDVVTVSRGEPVEIWVELGEGQRVDFSLVASRPVELRFEGRTVGDVDQFHFTFVAPQRGHYAIVLVNPAKAPAHVATFLRTSDP